MRLNIFLYLNHGKNLKDPVPECRDCLKLTRASLLKKYCKLREGNKEGRSKGIKFQKLQLTSHSYSKIVRKNIFCKWRGECFHYNIRVLRCNIFLLKNFKLTKTIKSYLLHETSRTQCVSTDQYSSMNSLLSVYDKYWCWE